jgi:hypothetical protein
VGSSELCCTIQFQQCRRARWWRLVQTWMPPSEYLDVARKTDQPIQCMKVAPQNLLETNCVCSSQSWQYNKAKLLKKCSKNKDHNFKYIIYTQTNIWKTKGLVPIFNVVFEETATCSQHMYDTVDLRFCTIILWNMP